MPERQDAAPRPDGAASFSARLIDWQRRQGRHDLPWQNTRDAYRIWLSEIMLQQTQVGTVMPYYERFLARFPDISSLAAAPIDAVMQLWSGLGYYSRARNLHRAAALMVERHAGQMPASREAIEQLPGIGRSTAAAIATFAFGAREAILDGNVKRVLARHQAIEGLPASSAVLARLWAVAETFLPGVSRSSEVSPASPVSASEDLIAYCQGLMDLGATVCTRARPACERCPVTVDCEARLQNRVHELPTPRARRVQPLRATSMLVLLQGDDVLLERRPSTGIWGGLWSLPELQAGDDPVLVARQRFGLEVIELRPLPRLRHGFTHFSLDIDPLAVRVLGRQASLGEPGALWLPLAEAGSAAVPVPVRRILASLCAGQSPQGALDLPA